MTTLTLYTTIQLRHNRLLSSHHLQLAQVVVLRSSIEAARRWVVEPEDPLLLQRVNDVESSDAAVAQLAQDGDQGLLIAIKIKQQFTCTALPTASLSSAGPAAAGDASAAAICVGV